MDGYGVVPYEVRITATNVLAWKGTGAFWTIDTGITLVGTIKLTASSYSDRGARKRVSATVIICR